MSYVYFFRGKAATGKTTITNILSNKIKVAVLRKDEIINYYSNSTIELLENEYVIDSSKNLGEIMENIYSIIDKTTL